ncbi:MAG: hypothetical protein HY360_11965 [Verrucomicrobia bacterium]|nr:hypothetical protein [Verrucomicrobiota bacterium]
MLYSHMSQKLALEQEPQDWPSQAEKMKETDECPWWKQANDHLYLEAIQRMLPKSDQQHIGSEYFAG